jgi:3-hydroxybutyrate dehydrogenase
MGRSVIVTGAASGIGRATADKLRAGGDDVLEVDLHEGFTADLTTREGNRAAVDEALSRFGRLDAVVANAGFQHVSPVEDFDEDRWDALLAILLTSPFLLAKYAWPALRESGSGRFVAIASAHALVASPFKAGYVSAKHGVLGLVRTLALEGAADGISASAVCPGYVRTPLVEKQIPDQMKSRNMTEEQVKRDVLLAAQPPKEFVTIEQVASLALYLCSDAASAITGANLSIDGGWTAA